MDKKNINIKLLLLVLIGIFFVTSGLGCKKGLSSEDLKPVNLVYWRTDDDRGDFSLIIQDFQNLYPNVSITYKKIKKEEYSQKLLEAWAEDRGPDIFSIPNIWLKKYESKIVKLPLNTQFSMPQRVEVGDVQKRKEILEKQVKIPSLRDLQKRYVATVYQNILENNDKLYGLPLSLDTLVMYYNRDILDSNGIPSPPSTWLDFVKDVKLLTLQDRNGNFIQSGTALGSADNIKYSTDILSLLMMQNGASMVNDYNRANFDKSLPNDRNYYPGREAMDFYTSFSNPAQSRYSWNQNMPDDFNTFVSGRLGFLFGYSDYLKEIKKQAPKLNFDIAQIPQISDSLKSTNYAKFPIEVVSKTSSYQKEAWAFLLYASQKDNVKTFLEKAKRPTAHRELIEFQLKDFDLAPFANQVLTAKTWYNGSNYQLVEEAFNSMINSVITGQKSVKEAINYGVDKINLTY